MFLPKREYTNLVVRVGERKMESQGQRLRTAVNTLMD